MLIRGSAEDKNHNPILHFTWVISPYYFSLKVIFFVMSFSLQVVYKICRL